MTTGRIPAAGYLRTALAGAVLAGASGVVAGLVWPHWGPWTASKIYTWLLGLLLAAPLGALLGVLLAVRRDRGWFTDEPVPSSGRRAGAVAAVLLMTAALVASAVVLTDRPRGEPTGTSGRVHWETKNTTRFGAADPTDTAAAVARAVFPGDAPDAVVLAAQDPVAVTAAAPLLRTLNGPLLLLSEDGGLSGDAQLLLADWADSRVVVVGAKAPAGSGVASTDEPASTEPAQLFEGVNELLAAEGVDDRPSVSVAGGPEQLLPAAAWLVHEPSPLVWQGGGDVALTGLADDPVEEALAVAAFRDDALDVGWGIGPEDPESWHTNLFANPSQWQQAAAGLALAGWGKPGPLLWTDPDGGMPRAVETALWPTGPAFGDTPAEGPYNHLFVLGDLDAVPYDIQARADYVVEIGPVQTRGAGVTWVEVLLIIWLLTAGVSGLGLLHDAVLRLPVHPVVALSWGTAGLVLGPLAVALYVAAYRHRERQVLHGISMWKRPMWIQAAVATSRSVAAGTFTMIATSAFVMWWGAPMWVNDVPYVSWLGNAMSTTMLLVAYLVALAVSTLVFMAPQMQAHHLMRSGSTPSYLRAVVPALRNMAINMTVLTVFMFAGMWLWMRFFMQMGADPRPGLVQSRCDGVVSM